LRNKQKSKVVNETKEEDKGEAKKVEAKKPDPKDKKGDKKGGPADAKEDAGQNQYVETATGLRAQQSELDQIQHYYTYLNLKRSSKPANAIYAVDVVIADAETGPTHLIKQGWESIVIPIEQYTGILATYHTAPFLIFKRSNNLLRDENEKKS